MLSDISVFQDIKAQSIIGEDRNLSCMGDLATESPDRLKSRSLLCDLTMMDQFTRPSVKSFTGRGCVECEGCVGLCSCTQESWGERDSETIGHYLQSEP